MKRDKRTTEQIVLDDALISAIKASDTHAVVSLLAKGADPNCSTEADPWGFGALPISALMLAMTWYCRRETVGFTEDGNCREQFNEPLIRALIESGANLSKFSECDEPPLCQAVGMITPSRYELVTFMLDRGADINELHNGILSALHHAVGAPGDVAMVTLLLDLGADINPQTGYESPLMRAVALKHKEVVALLLARGADANYRTKSGETALSKAKWKRGVGNEIREMLLATGVIATDSS